VQPGGPFIVLMLAATAILGLDPAEAGSAKAVGGPTLSYKSIISSPMRENVAGPPGHAGTIRIGNSPRSPLSFGHEG
jgi:hypothetical protein